MATAPSATGPDLGPLPEVGALWRRIPPETAPPQGHPAMAIDADTRAAVIALMNAIAAEAARRQAQAVAALD